MASSTRTKGKRTVRRQNRSILGLIFLVINRYTKEHEEFILESNVADFLKGKVEKDWIVYRRVDGIRASD